MNYFKKSNYLKKKIFLKIKDNFTERYFANFKARVSSHFFRENEFAKSNQEIYLFSLYFEKNLNEN